MSGTSINWFEIPVRDVAKAAEFYGTVLGIELGEMEGSAGPMRIFMKDEQPMGCLTAAREPLANSLHIYLDAVGDLDGAVERIGPAGGEVVMPKTSIGEWGHIAQMRDPDGNLIGLHSL